MTKKIYRTELNEIKSLKIKCKNPCEATFDIPLKGTSFSPPSIAFSKCPVCGTTVNAVYSQDIIRLAKDILRINATAEENGHKIYIETELE